MPSRQNSTHTHYTSVHTLTHAGVRDVHGYSLYHNPKPQVVHCHAQAVKSRNSLWTAWGHNGNIPRYQVCAGAIPCCVMPPCPAHCLDLFPQRKTTDIHTLITTTTYLQPAPVPQQLRPYVLHAPSSHGCACHHSSNPTTYTSKVLAAPGLAAAPPTRWSGYHQTTSMPPSPRDTTRHMSWRRCGDGG